MIDYIEGVLKDKEMAEKDKSQGSVTIETGGIGYKVFMTAVSCNELGEENSQIKIYIVENVAGMYGGVINLYGFLTKQERDIYLLLKEVPGTGAKKAMEYLDKILKSPADFKAAVLIKDGATLHSIFGFTKTTSDKIIASLKEKIGFVSVGEEKWGGRVSSSHSNIVQEAISALISLGYKESQATQAVQSAYRDDENVTLSELIKKSLKFV